MAVPQAKRIDKLKNKATSEMPMKTFIKHEITDINIIHNVLREYENRKLCISISKN